MVVGCAGACEVMDGEARSEVDVLLSVLPFDEVATILEESGPDLGRSSSDNRLDGDTAHLQGPS